MDMAVNEMFFEKYPDTVLSHQVQVRPFNAEKTRNMRALNPEGKEFISKTTDGETLSIHLSHAKSIFVYLCHIYLI